MTTHELLVTMRNHLNDESAWAKDYKVALYGNSPTCVGLAACNLGTGAVPAGQALQTILEAAGIAPRGDLVDAIIEWNDAPETSHAAMLAVLDKAIAATAPAPDVSFIREPVEA